jgi:1-acyl-sn-glycerol-3-phosphate acyltransferase
MTVPPRWLRRVVIAPLVALGILVAFTSVPLLAVVAVIASAFLPGTWRGLRLLAFAMVYAAVELVGLVTLFGSWLASGCGDRLRSPGFVDFHYAVLARAVDVVVRTAMRLFHLDLELESDVRGHPTRSTRRPAIVAARHAGPGDSFLLVHGLMHRSARRPRIVLKDTLQLDPFIDVLVNRLPSRFVHPRPGGGDEVTDAIGQLARSMGQDDALVIFPEGGNYTPRRHRKAVDRLRAGGRAPLADQAEQLRFTLPPRPAGIAAAMAALPEARVILVGHTGVDHMVTVRDVWRGLPEDKTLHVRWTPFVVEDGATDPESIGEALMAAWLDLDRWIANHREANGAGVERPGRDPEA